jgi:chemotaxis-related protein WspD
MEYRMSTIKTDDDPHAKCRKRIGVYGDSSCLELKKYSHCQNCPKFLAAGKTLYDRGIPPETLEEWTVLYSSAKVDEVQGDLLVVIFRLKKEWLALKASFFQEATELHPVHIIPLRSNKIFRGLVNINGELILCISMADIIGLSDEYVEVSSRKVYRRICVLNNGGERFAIPVDEVRGIRRIVSDALLNPPATIAKSLVTYTVKCFNLEDMNVGLLDENRLFDALKRSVSA